MTNTYLIHAWCVRPFISYLDEVHATTPEEAITIARSQPAKLLDTAEECNGEYPWDEFAVYGEYGNELLHLLDDEARLRNAAPVLRDALLYVAQMLAGLKPDFLRQIGLDMALEHAEKALAIADDPRQPAADATDDEQV